MPRIDSIRLRELRELKRLSRRELAEQASISERQLARIEAKEGPAQVRSYNLDRLVRALELPPEVLTGEEPVPGGFGDPSGLEIHPHALRALRERERLTRAELAERSNVPERRIAQLESSAKKTIRSTAEALAKALGTNVETLSQDGSDLPLDPGTGAEPVRMAVTPSTQLRLAYDLIGHRYGPSRAQIVELAPLLFALVAEGCLARRRRCLKEVDQAADRLRQLANGESQLYFTPYLLDVEHGAGLENESVESVDLLGDKVREDDWAWQNFAEDELNGVTPFADYLCKLAKELDADGIVDFFPTESEATVGLDAIWGAEPYQVCGDILTELTGGSKHARWALAYGDVQLSRMPRDLLHEDAKDARVKWLEDRLSDDVREERERWEAFLKSVSVEILSNKDAASGDSP